LGLTITTIEIVVGLRPNFIKIAPTIKALKVAQARRGAFGEESGTVCIVRAGVKLVGSGRVESGLLLWHLERRKSTRFQCFSAP